MNKTLHTMAAVYGALLRLYPVVFRHEFAEEMATVFADSLAGAAQEGREQVVLLCWREVRDLPGSMFREHWRATTQQEPAAMTAIRKPEWSFYVSWVVMSAAGFALGFAFSWSTAKLVGLLVGPDLVAGGVRRITDDYVFSLLQLPALSVATGTLQYTLLRQYLPGMGWWIPATMVGWSLSSLMLRVRPDMLIWLLGLALSAPQWLVLRRLPASGWWLIANGALGSVTFPALVLAMALLAPDWLHSASADLGPLVFILACTSGLVLGLIIAQAAAPQPDVRQMRR